MGKVWALLIIKGIKLYSDFTFNQQTLILSELNNLVQTGVITEERKNQLIQAL